MNSNVHIVAMSGSLRKGSYNTHLLHAVTELLPEGITMEIASIADIPLYNADLDVPTAERRPPAVEAFRNTMAKADAFLFVSPEYNYSIPGGLKNAIDWASRGKDSPMLNKAAALMGATTGLWGTVRMQLAFRPVFLFLNMTGLNKPEVLVAQAQNKFDENGKLTDQTTKDLIKQQLAALQKLVIEMRFVATMK
jgi:chromate reductase, NAD(P)H dehydrogenase (quinone)